MIRKIFTVIILLLALNANSQVDYKIKRLLFKDDFNNTFINWIVEKQKTDSEIVTIQNGKLLLDTYNGATVWLKQELKGNYLIKLKRSIIVQGGKNDRLSDCNFFWMVTDSLQNNMFKRNGGFKEYDSLSMYYIGFGGNYNTTTRFRKYSAKGDKQILGEYKDAAHLLEANKTYSIEILVMNGLVEFKVDGKIFFTYTDATPLTNGFFAIRSTRSRQEIDDVEIYEIE